MTVTETYVGIQNGVSNGEADQRSEGILVPRGHFLHKVWTVVNARLGEVQRHRAGLEQQLKVAEVGFRGLEVHAFLQFMKEETKS